jgi:hypothetical protein
MKKRKGAEMEVPPIKISDYYLGLVGTPEYPPPKPKSKKYRASLKQNAKNRIPLCETLWKKQKNPLFVKEAFVLSIENGIEVPDWVKEYFYVAAYKMISSKCDKAGQAQSIACENLKLKGKSFTNYHKLNTNILITTQSLKEHNANPEKIFYAIDSELSEKKETLRIPINIRPSTIARYRSEYGEYAKENFRNPSFPRTFPQVKKSPPAKKR